MTSKTDPSASAARAPRRRATPWAYAAQVVGELRSSRWPSVGSAARSTALVLSGLTLMAVLVWSLDLLLVGGVTRLLSAIGDVAAPYVVPVLVGAHVVSLVAAAVLLLRHPAPTGGANLFGAAASDSGGGSTPGERRLDRRTAVAVAAYALTALALALVL